MTSFGARPDFVLVGGPNPRGDGVILIASRTLLYADLQHEFNYGDFYSLTDLWSARITLQIEMPTYTLIKAATHQEAFAKLFHTWNPEQPNDPQKEIDQGRRSITDGASSQSGSVPDF